MRSFFICSRRSWRLARSGRAWRVVADRLVHRRWNGRSRERSRLGILWAWAWTWWRTTCRPGESAALLQDREAPVSRLPRAGSATAARSEHPLAERMRAYFRGERVSFDDVELDAEWGTPFQQALAEALRAVPWGEIVTAGSWPRWPAGLVHHALRARSAPRTTSRSSSRVTAWSRRPVWGATARSSTTSDGCWPWRASTEPRSPSARARGGNDCHPRAPSLRRRWSLAVPSQTLPKLTGPGGP